MKKSFSLSLFYSLLLLVLITSCGTKKSVSFLELHYPKHEFRGAWIQTAWQNRYQSMNSAQMKAYFINLLNNLQTAGINAVIFQVRPQADAFYRSEFEPWSSFMTGQQGQGLPDGFDPLEFLVVECHKRNMELHAWLNPYRVKMSENQILVKNHIYFREPQRFVKYGNQVFFDPGIPENRMYICKIVRDIVSRYNVDAIHMDDYFYPYPIPGKPFPDERSFRKYASDQGFKSNQRDDWRRSNVNMLIKEIKGTILSIKPWVRFGISPFGIYRNSSSPSDNSGSNTRGLQNYDDLYADVKLWVDKGWIDYNMPQIYWELGHASADYSMLVQWWAENVSNRPLYIGQDVMRTMKAKGQLSIKMEESRSFKAIQGNCFWSGYDVADNYGEIANLLKSDYHKYTALIPPYTHMSKHRPKKVKKLKEVYTNQSHYLEWEAKGYLSDPEEASYFVVYRFKEGQKENIDNAANIVGITSKPRYELPYEGGKQKYNYVITAVNVYHNESKGQSKKIKL